MKQQKAAVRTERVTRTAGSSTKKGPRCKHVERVMVDQDEHADWPCTLWFGHRGKHLVGEPKGARRLAIDLTPEEVAYWKGFDAGKKVPWWDR